MIVMPTTGVVRQRLDGVLVVPLAELDVVGVPGVFCFLKLMACIYRKVRHKYVAKDCEYPELSVAGLGNLPSTPK